MHIVRSIRCICFPSRTCCTTLSTHRLRITLPGIPKRSHCVRNYLGLLSCDNGKFHVPCFLRFLLIARSLSPYSQNIHILRGTLVVNDHMAYLTSSTYAGIPIAAANAAKIVLPFPYPNALYIAGANNGNPKPARERKHDTAASARSPRDINEY